MEFKKYQHVERFGTSEVEGIEIGLCYIFPKLDGANASIWWNEDSEEGLQSGSRRRHLSLDNDLTYKGEGFHEWALKQDLFFDLLIVNKHLRFYGEWLVPHSLKTYMDKAWKKFYVFDVFDHEKERLLSYDEYKPILDHFGIDYIPPIATIEDPSTDQLYRQLDINNYLIKDGQGVGEGIVVKNYNFVNKFGRQTWAKIVTSEFKERHLKEMGAPAKKGFKQIEREIAKTYVTKALCEKIKSKIEMDCGGWSSRYIPRLLNTVYYDIINEDAWNFVKKYKNPTIDFSKLKLFVTDEVKKKMPIVFGTTLPNATIHKNVSWNEEE